MSELHKLKFDSGSNSNSTIRMTQPNTFNNKDISHMRINSLIFDIKEDLNKSTFYYYLTDAVLMINYEYEPIQSIRLQTLFLFGNITKDNNTFNIDISRLNIFPTNFCLEKISNNIKYQIINIDPTFKTNYLDNIYLLNKYTYDNESPQNIQINPMISPLVQSKYEYTQLLLTNKIVYQTAIDRHIHKFTTDGMFKGFFVYTNIRYLKNLSLILNGITVFDYDEYDIRLYCLEINPHILYVPIVDNLSYNDSSLMTYVGSINGARIRNIELKIGWIGKRQIFEFSTLISSRIDYENNNLTMYKNMYGDDNIRYIYNRSNNEILIKFLDRSKVKNYECPISFEIIKDGDYYAQCPTCKYNFLYNNINEWINRLNNKFCPCCKQSWITIYKLHNIKLLSAY